MPKPLPFELEIDGQMYHGTYVIQGEPPGVSVTWESGSKTTQLGSLPAKHVIRYLLQDLIKERKAAAVASRSQDLSGDSASPRPRMVPSGQRESATRTATAADSEIRRPPPLSCQRLPGESARDYHAYCLYRNLGVDRSLQQAWQVYCASQGRFRAKSRGRPRQEGVVTHCPGAWTALSKKYRWLERAKQYDAWRDTLRQEHS